MSTVINPLVFVDSSRAPQICARAPSMTGFGWYLIEWIRDGRWSAHHSITGLIGSYASRAEAAHACGAADVNQGQKWLREHP